MGDILIRPASVIVSKKEQIGKEIGESHENYWNRFGDINSAAAVLEGGRPVLVPSAEGTSLYGKAFPSYVAFTRTARGSSASQRGGRQWRTPRGRSRAFKRKMGTTFKYKILGKDYTPQELSAILLQKIKRDAEASSARQSRRRS